MANEQEAQDNQEPNSLQDRLRGRAAYLNSSGRVKDAELMVDAAVALDLAAAPDLLAALQVLIEAPTFEVYREQARAAIARATGANA